jgi:GH24 family phage-related lysozyme (muramidase)
MSGLIDLLSKDKSKEQENQNPLKELLQQVQDGTIKNYIKSNEGYDPNIYKDSKKIPTTGYGFNLNAEHVRKVVPADVLAGKRALSEQESNDIFENLYSVAVDDAKKYVTPAVFDAFPSNIKQALIDVSYNVGGPALMGFKNMRNALLVGDFKTASKELLNSKYAREDVPVRALKNSKLIYSKEK